MIKVRGNITAQFQTFSTIVNSIGEEVTDWTTVAEVKGWLDLSSGNNSYQNYNARTIEATHIFICDCFDVEKDKVGKLLINGKEYNVTYFDEPMGLNTHYEIYLKEVTQDV